MLLKTEVLRKLWLLDLRNLMLNLLGLLLLKSRYLLLLSLLELWHLGLLHLFCDLLCHLRLLGLLKLRLLHLELLRVLLRLFEVVLLRHFRVLRHLMLLVLHRERILHLLWVLHLEMLLLHEWVLHLMVLLHLRVLHVLLVLLHVWVHHVRVLLHLLVHLLVVHHMRVLLHVRVLRHLVWVLLWHLVRVLLRHLRVLRHLLLLRLSLLLGLCLLLLDLLEWLGSLLRCLGSLLRLLHLEDHALMLGLRLVHRALGLFLQRHLAEVGNLAQRAGRVVFVANGAGWVIFVADGPRGGLGSGEDGRLRAALVEGAHFDGLLAVEDDGRGHRERALGVLFHGLWHLGSAHLRGLFGQGALGLCDLHWHVRDLCLELQGTVVCGLLGSGVLHLWSRGRGLLTERSHAASCAHVVREVEAQVKVAIVAEVSGESCAEIERGSLLDCGCTRVLDVGGSGRSSSCEWAASSTGGLNNGQWAVSLGASCRDLVHLESQVEVHGGGLHLRTVIL